MSGYKPSFNKVLLTLGATREAIDPVRYISNRSSGKMGVALIKAFKKQGCEVHAVKAHCENVVIPKGVEILDVSSSNEMQASVNQEIEKFAPDLFVGCAAVSDFIPHKSVHKIKKQNGLHLTFADGPDIIAGVVGRCPYVAGFAAETTNVEENAYIKLHKKKLNVIFANDAERTMGMTHSQVLIITKNDTLKTEVMTKDRLAKALVQWLLVDWQRTLADAQNKK